jgi:hypothetical protein
MGHTAQCDQPHGGRIVLTSVHLTLRLQRLAELYGPLVDAERISAHCSTVNVRELHADVRQHFKDELTKVADKMRELLEDIPSSPQACRLVGACYDNFRAVRECFKGEGPGADATVLKEAADVEIDNMLKRQKSRFKSADTTPGRAAPMIHLKKIAVNVPVLRGRVDELITDSLVACQMRRDYAIVVRTL